MKKMMKKKMDKTGFSTKGAGYGSKGTGSQGERKGKAGAQGGVAHVNNPRGITPNKMGTTVRPLSPMGPVSDTVGK